MRDVVQDVASFVIRDDATLLTLLCAPARHAPGPRLDASEILHYVMRRGIEHCALAGMFDVSPRLESENRLDTLPPSR